MFKKFIEAFINKFFHRCKWKIITKIDMYKYRDSLPVSRKYILQCKECGLIKEKEV